MSDTLTGAAVLLFGVVRGTDRQILSSMAQTYGLAAVREALDEIEHGEPAGTRMRALLDRTPKIAKAEAPDA